LLRSSSGPLSQEWTVPDSSTYVPALHAGTVDLRALPSEHLDLPADAGQRRGRFRSVGRDVVYRRALAVADAIAATGASFLALAVVGQGRTSAALLAVIPLIVIMSKGLGTYNRQDLLVRKSTLDEAPALFQLATFYSLAAWLIDGVVIGGYRDRWELAVLWTGLFLLLVVLRSAGRWLSRRLTEPERCLVIGDDASCDWMQLKFARRRSLHAVVVARVVPTETDVQSAPMYLDADDLHQLVAPLHVDRIIITPGRADEDGVINVVHAATSLGLKVSVLPRVLQVVGSSSQFDDVEGVPLLSLRPLGLTRTSRVTKRALDIAGSTFCLLLLSPLLAAIALLIKVDSRGSVLFRQNRIGRDGKAFPMLKFRTMVQNADEYKDQLRHLNQADGLFKIATDPRITRAGRLLRRTSLDELPQLLNVIRGEMSLVGPRPLVVDEDSRLEGWRRRRLHLTPGMTGHWQILGSARIPLEEMARIDYLYVSNWSLWLDVKILLRTIPYVLTAKGM
jgi:exopolysaccharide biosynthesis polyprenyl glycosylphosphotransferase